VSVKRPLFPKIYTEKYAKYGQTVYYD